MQCSRDTLSDLAPRFSAAVNIGADLLRPEKRKSSCPGWISWISFQITFWPLCAISNWSQQLESSQESQLRSAGSEGALRQAGVGWYLYLLGWVKLKAATVWSPKSLPESISPGCLGSEDTIGSSSS